MMYWLCMHTTEHVKELYHHLVYRNRIILLQCFQQFLERHDAVSGFSLEITWSYCLTMMISPPIGHQSVSGQQELGQEEMWANGKLGVSILYVQPHGLLGIMELTTKFFRSFLMVLVIFFHTGTISRTGITSVINSCFFSSALLVLVGTSGYRNSSPMTEKSKNSGNCNH